MKMDDTGWSFGHVDARSTVTTDHLRMRHEEHLRRVAGLTEAVEVAGQRVRNGMVVTVDGDTLTVATETGQVTVPAGTFGTVAL